MRSVDLAVARCGQVVDDQMVSFLYLTYCWSVVHAVGLRHVGMDSSCLGYNTRTKGDGAFDDTLLLQYEYH